MSSPPKHNSARHGHSIPPGLLESPTAKRAKRNRSNRKNRVRRANRSSTTNDWVSSDQTFSTENSFARKETPIPPPKLPYSQDFNGPMKVEKESTGYQNNTKQFNSSPGEISKNGTGVNSSQTAANTRKTRAEPQSNGRRGHHSNGFNYYQAPADPGPSNPWVNKSPAPPAKELTPLSEFTPIRSMTFKDFPNPVANRLLPPVIQVSPEPKKRKCAASTKEHTPATTTATHDNNTDASMTPTVRNITNNDISSAPTSPTIPVTSPIPTSTPSQDGSSGSGTKTLKAINKRLKSLEAGLAALTTTTAAAAAAGSSAAGSFNAVQGDSHAHGCGQGSQSPDGKVMEAVEDMRSSLRSLSDRVVRNEMRAAIRYDILFHSLVKIAGEVATVSNNVVRMCNTGDEGQDGDGDGDGKGKGVAVSTPSHHRRGTPASQLKEENKSWEESLRKSRSTLEICLKIYTADMNAAETEQDVEKHGRLVEAYAKDVIRTFF